MKRLLDPGPFYSPQALGFLRIVVGGFLIYHGIEIFEPDIMEMYLAWDVFRGDLGAFKAYSGKASELTAGILLFLGLLTRVGALIAIGVFTYIPFVVGQGRIWYEDQHPFMFALMGVLFLFSGPGAWSVDAWLFKTTNT
jgi:putative oxidoreductase